jgi:hypothetical protein
MKASESISSLTRSAGISALQKLASPKIRSKPQINSTTAIYIGGFAFQKLRNVWAALKEARFQISRIVEIQWIGKTVLEFIVAQDYELQFVSEMKATNSFKILKFDPTSNSRAISAEQSETAMRSFAVRCVKNIIFGSSSILRNHFKKVADKAVESNTALKVFLDVEYKRAIDARDVEIAAIEASLNVINPEFSSEHLKDARRLLVLSPGHDLAKQVLDKLKSVSAGGGQWETEPATSGW